MRSITSPPNSTLLTYALTTDPSPVQVGDTLGSPASELTLPSIAELSIVVSNNQPDGTTVYVSNITIVLPIGSPQSPASTDLTEVPVSVDQFSISPSTGWNSAASDAFGTYYFTPLIAPLPVTEQGYVITITGIEVSSMVGVADVIVYEQASTSPETHHHDDDYATCMLAVPKFPVGFTLGSFSAQQPQVQSGGSVTLLWEGSDNATYTMLWGSSPPQSQDVSGLQQWPTPALFDTTTFVLQVSAQEFGQTVTQYLSTTVVVTDPVVTASELTVLTTSALQGATTVGTPDANADLTVNGSAAVTGQLTVGVSGVTTTVVSPLVTVYGNLSLPSDSLYAVNISGSNSVTTGSLSVGDGGINASGDISTSGNITAQGGLAVGYASGDPAPTAGDITASGSITASGNITTTGMIYAGTSSLSGHAIYPINSDATHATIYTTNDAGNGGNNTGVYADIANSADYGFATNGQIQNGSGTLVYTRVKHAEESFRVVTAPMVLNHEIQLSGRAQLGGGRVFVRLPADAAALLAEGPYRVLLTPGEDCGTLYVTDKSLAGFQVRESQGGQSNAPFDWFLIGLKRRGLDDPAPHPMPESLPHPLKPRKE